MNSYFVKILGVKISRFSKTQAIDLISGWFLKKKCLGKIIATPNPEMLVKAYFDHDFLKLLNRADLCVADGWGLVLGSGLKIRERCAGIDLMLGLCELASLKKYSIGLIGGQKGIAARTARVLKRQFTGIKIKFCVSEISEIKNKSQVDLLFVAMGAGKQEMVLNNLKFKISNLKFKVGVGVGGAFDMICGKTPRAPLFFQKAGLEWLWRLILEPKRIKRIFNAVFVFPLLVVKEKLPHVGV